MLNEIYKKVQNEKSQSINLLRDIVNIESFSGSKSNVDNLSKFLSGKCETLGGRTKNNPLKQAAIAKIPAEIEIFGVKRTAPDKIRPTPIHRPAQLIIRGLKSIYSGPLKFKITANHDEGKMNAAVENRTMIGFLSLTASSFRSNAYVRRNRGNAE